ncbi:MAG: hypothetical protein FIA99_17365 [Ruminiclostridium sp.]|nr:hypothetical protein [Ruminiclostridium sp.]
MEINDNGIKISGGGSMNRYDQNVKKVMAFLKDRKYAPSTLYTHKSCYEGLRSHLKQTKLEYSFDEALSWLECRSGCLGKRQAASYRHCLAQLDDVYRFGSIQSVHLLYRLPPYRMLSDQLLHELHMFLDSIETENMRQNLRIYCSKFLLFLQEAKISSIAETTYVHINHFLNDDSHQTRKSQDAYERAARRLLAFHHRESGISIGLSYTCDKQMSPHIQLPNEMPDSAIEEVTRLRSESLGFPLSKYHDAIDGYMDCLKKHRYSKNVIKHAKRTCRLLYLFFDMHGTGYSLELSLLWLSELKHALGSSWKQTRRVLMQFNQFTMLGDITPGKVFRYKDTRLSKLPGWCRDKVAEYLDIRKKEGMAKSTIDMARSSCVRFCNFLIAQGIPSFHDIEARHLVLFNRSDPHATAEGKSAYNVRIRMFLEYLEENELSDKPLLHLALPCQYADKERVMVVLNGDEIAKIVDFCHSSQTPYELRRSATVLIGVRMGLRASDVVNIKFSDIDWPKQTLSIVQTKTLKALTLPLPVEVANSIYRYVKDGRPHSDSPYLFTHHKVPYGKLGRSTCTQAIQSMLDGNTCGGFHTARRTFATNLLQGGVGVGTIVESLGHSTDGTVNKYLSLDEKGMRLCAISLEEAGILLPGGCPNE